MQAQITGQPRLDYRPTGIESGSGMEQFVGGQPAGQAGPAQIDGPLVAWQALLAETRDRPWLMRLLLDRGAALFEPFIQHYQALLSLSRQRRRALLRRAGTGLAGAALFLALAGTAVYAADISVDGTTCTLVDAITAANTDSATGGCIAGDSGPDTITLLDNVTLTGVNNVGTFGSNGLPVITSTITIEGAGFTISRDNAAPAFRLFEVVSTGDLTLNQVTLTGGNSPNEGGGYQRGYGGAVRVSDGKVTLNRSTLDGNQAPYGGGGIDSRSATVTIHASHITNNSSTSRGGSGLRNLYGPVSISNSTLSGNNNTQPGGAIYNYRGTLTVTNSTLSNNDARLGGAIYSYQGSLTITNTTISGNYASYNGGGIFLDRGTLIATNLTIASNTASNKGGGIHNFDMFTLEGSLVSGNTASSGAEIYNGGTLQSSQNLLGHSGETNADAFAGFTPDVSDITATSDGTNSTALTSILTTTLASNGGPTLTHALVSGSPAIDAIPDSTPRGRAALAATCAPGTSYDQRGVFRANGGTAPTGTGNACDIGAFEFGLAPTSVTIAGFSAQTAWGSGPQLAWETGNESGLSGFHIWLGTATAAQTRLTADLIGASGGLNGSEYTWQDSVAFGWGERVWYWLEAVSADGSSAFTGPVEVWGLGKLFLPAIGR